MLRLGFEAWMKYAIFWWRLEAIFKKDDSLIEKSSKGHSSMDGASCRKGKSGIVEYVSCHVAPIGAQLHQPNAERLVYPVHQKTRINSCILALVTLGSFSPAQSAYHPQNSMADRSLSTALVSYVG